MIRFTYIFLILFFSVELLQAQTPINQDAVKENKSTFNKSDIITPVLQRSYQPNSSDQQIKGYTENSGVVFLSSAILPGSGQLMNENWVKAGLFLAIEATSIYFMADYNKRGRRGERNYEQWADENWSVVQYSNWLVDYHEVHGIDNPYLDELKENIDGTEASFNTNTDWNSVDLETLRRVERNTPYLTTDDAATRNFSHVLPSYGTQQYYELISKYYQYQSGWKDYNSFHNNLGHTGSLFNERFLIDRNGEYASPLFFDGADRAHQFNENFRTGNYFTTLLILNHVASAFDAFFTLNLRKNRFKATTGSSPTQQLKVSINF